jgi:hypothetical protein
MDDIEGNESVDITTVSKIMSLEKITLTLKVIDSENTFATVSVYLGND